MSEDEQKLVDTAGDYCYAVKNGEPVADPQWNSCRLVMTNRRLVLANNSGKQTVPHSNIEIVDDDVVPDAIDAAGATPLRIGDNVVLFDATGVSDFEREYCRATLHGEIILANHPAVVGGVVQDDSEWQKTRFQQQTTGDTAPGSPAAARPVSPSTTSGPSRRRRGRLWAKRALSSKSNTPTRRTGASRPTSPGWSTTPRHSSRCSSASSRTARATTNSRRRRIRS